MLCVFGYMVFLIVFKWCVNWDQDGIHNAPNLIQTMIGMFLNKGGLPEGQSELYPGQVGLQTTLLLIAFLSVPILLFGKPCALNRKYKKKGLLNAETRSPKHNGLEHEEKKDDGAAIDVDNEEKSPADKAAHMVVSDEAAGGGGHGHGPFNFNDELIHNAIHTIEFVLGCVSNTASYLRLWALSLAHAELASVFWNKMIQEKGINSGSPIMVFCGFAVWFGATFAVLLAMDVLECFLHALRLHWVVQQHKHNTRTNNTRTSNFKSRPSNRIQPHPLTTLILNGLFCLVFVRLRPSFPFPDVLRVRVSRFPSLVDCVLLR